MRPFRPSIFLSIACLGLVTLASGCGGSTIPSMTGTWTFYAVSSLVPSEPPKTLTGKLTSSGSAVTGTLAFSNACFSGQQLKFSGSIGTDNSLQINSKQQPYNNQVVYFAGTVSTDGSLVTAGSYTVSANNSSQPICDTGDAGSLTGSRTSTLAVANPASADTP